jgi:ketosteroid isomerase-like protein
MNTWLICGKTILVVGIFVSVAPIKAVASSAEDEKIVAALDTQYQAAVEKNDADTMDRILADDFVLVTGLGKTYTKADLLKSARSKSTVYEHQEDSSQKVRVWGDTAVVTALLWMKGTEDGKPFDNKLWFSDTYARTPTGWRYVFGQASMRMRKVP